ncbi:MAG: hypothetical protein KatS3mg111_0770 [Pirellulaceae bacterium]|nr:MAG: hypothetical protein KatS3mg111_0770 [Pirellulaceae bacterium]
MQAANVRDSFKQGIRTVSSTLVGVPSPEAGSLVARASTLAAPCGGSMRTGSTGERPAVESDAARCGAALRLFGGRAHVRCHGDSGHVG